MLYMLSFFITKPLVLCLFLSLPAVLSVMFGADLGSPKGIRFSDVTDTSATVHWVVPRARVDSYKVTYVPAHGGQNPVSLPGNRKYGHLMCLIQSYNQF